MNGIYLQNFTVTKYNTILKIQIIKSWASLVVHWLRIHLAMQGTPVQSLVREDPTCCGATKPCVPQLLTLHSRVREPQQEKLQQ